MYHKYDFSSKIPRWIKAQTCNKSMKSFFHNNDKEMYSAHNEGKSALLKDSWEP